MEEIGGPLHVLQWTLSEVVAMTEPSILLRYMGIFHPVEAPEGRDAYAHFADPARSFTEDFGCKDGQRLHFGVQYGRRKFYANSRSGVHPVWCMVGR